MSAVRVLIVHEYLASPGLVALETTDQASRVIRVRWLCLPYDLSQVLEFCACAYSL